MNKRGTLEWILGLILAVVIGIILFMLIRNLRVVGG